MDRLRVSMGQSDRDHIFAAATEAAMWIVALDKYLEEHDPDYVTRRDSDPDGHIVRGLRLARNCAVHDLVAVHKAVHTAETSTPPALVAVWKPLEPPRKQEDNLAAYEEHVCGKSVDQTLQAAWSFLWERADGGWTTPDTPYWLT